MKCRKGKCIHFKGITLYSTETSNTYYWCALTHDMIKDDWEWSEDKCKSYTLLKDYRNNKKGETDEQD